MDNLAVIILAAGKGQRMGSELPKALITTVESPLIEHVLQTSLALKPELTVVVTGHQAQQVETSVASSLKNKNLENFTVKFARQSKQQGTGDAVKSALSALEGFSGTVLILCADMPLVTSKTLLALLNQHRQAKATISLLSLINPEPASYGRIIRDQKTQQILKIVEARDCRPEELAINEINASIYVVDSAFLAPAVNDLKSNNAQAEYYLTDIVEKAVNEGQSVAALVSHDISEIQGINTPYDLALVNQTLRLRKIKALIESGVKILDPNTCYIESGCKISPGVQIGPNTQIKGDCQLESGVVIEGSCYLKNVRIGKNSLLRFAVRAEDCSIGCETAIGPFAHLRPGTELQDAVHIGNFVETKKAQLGSGSKANHLTYLGDCQIGANTNIGAGTITCNYDGQHKHNTTIGNGVFVGSNSLFIAPVKIEDGAFVGAGSVITKDVEKDSLAFSRSPQISKPGWAKKRREKT